VNLQDLLHKIVDGVPWSSEDNRAEAHQSVDDHFTQAAREAAEGTQL